MEQYGVMKKDDLQLHCIVITHPDGDHMNGIKKLLEKHGRNIPNKCDIVITKAFYWTSRDKPCEELTKLVDRAYPKRYDFEVETCLCLRSGLNCHFPTEMGCLFTCMPRSDVSKVSRTQRSKTYPKPECVDANATSILIVINKTERKCDVVLTGDSNAKEILPLVEGKEIRIFQVPHHGSSHNSRLEDSIKLEQLSKRYNLSIIQDQEVKKILLFYSTFKAKCYLISAGGTDQHNHPHSQVLQGIILANALRRQKCVILVTNNRGLILQKVKPLHQLRVPAAHDQELSWSEYVKIYHYNDVLEKQSDVVRLRPERCISDVHASALEWTPEGYIRKIRTILSQHDPKMSKIRPKDCFIQKSPVDIVLQGATTFSAHIICVPLPHSPRSGDCINHCYVIEESIAPGMQFSKALFLLNDDQMTLSRAKEYILFKYTNNEWKSKALDATVKDCTREISARDISFGDINESFRRSGDENRLVKFLVKGCGCKNPCDTDHCICRKNQCSCAPYCRCSESCKNNKVGESSSSKEQDHPNQKFCRCQPCCGNACAIM